MRMAVRALSRSPLLIPISTVPPRSRNRCFLLFVRHGGCYRKPEREARPAAWMRLGGDIAAHEAREPATDGQAEAGAAVRARVARVSLHEGLEQLVDARLRNADAAVDDGDLDPVVRRSIGLGRTGLFDGASDLHPTA